MPAAINEHPGFGKALTFRLNRVFMIPSKGARKHVPVYCVAFRVVFLKKSFKFRINSEIDRKLLSPVFALAKPKIKKPLC